MSKSPQYTRMRYYLLGPILASSLLLSGCYPSATKLLGQGEANYKAQNYHTAFYYILAAAKKGNTQAQYTAGYMYYYGIGTPHNIVQAIKWFDAAGRHGDPRAIQALQLLK